MEGHQNMKDKNREKETGRKPVPSQSLNEYNTWMETLREKRERKKAVKEKAGLIVDFIEWYYYDFTVKRGLITILILLIPLLILLKTNLVKHIDIDNILGISVKHFEEAQAYCSKSGKHLPGNAEEFSSVQNSDDSLNAGYWLSDGSIYQPKTHTVTKNDGGLHFFICID